MFKWHHGKGASRAPKHCKKFTYCIRHSLVWRAGKAIPNQKGFYVSFFHHSFIPQICMDSLPCARHCDGCWYGVRKQADLLLPSRKLEPRMGRTTEIRQKRAVANREESTVERAGVWQEVVGASAGVKARSGRGSPGREPHCAVAEGRGCWADLGGNPLWLEQRERHRIRLDRGPGHGWQCVRSGRRTAGKGPGRNVNWWGSNVGKTSLTAFVGSGPHWERPGKRFGGVVVGDESDLGWIGASPRGDNIFGCHNWCAGVGRTG